MVIALVLIETLWNVNRCYLQLSLPDDTVLIETLWNVNELLLKII